MKSIAKKSNKKAAFTIVELLVVMSIIMVLMGILLPAFNRAKRYAKRLSQKAQFHSIDAGLEMFKNDFETYPDSGRLDLNGDEYCGAMKLAEAMLGQDLLGFHPDSHFNCDDEVPADQRWPDGYYPDDPPDPPDPCYIENLRARRGPFVTVENARAHKLRQLYANTGAFSSCGEARYLLCDVYARVPNLTLGVLDYKDAGDKKIGMPVLYYRANTSNFLHEYSATDNSINIYNCDDNLMLLALGLPWNPPPDGPRHPLFEGLGRFYEITRDERITTTPRPFKPESYILISAGFDGLYGTRDDVFNFKR